MGSTTWWRSAASTLRCLFAGTTPTGLPYAGLFFQAQAPLGGASAAVNRLSRRCLMGGRWAAQRRRLRHGQASGQCLVIDLDAAALFGQRLGIQIGTA